jgi:hypothetical protein
MVKASKLRKFLEKVEAKLYQGSAKLRSKIKTEYQDVVVPASISATGRKELAHMKSSWIRSFQYDTHTRTLYMTTHKGKTYSWENVEPEIASEVTKGMAKCKTNDPSGKNRWWVDKEPSLGAAYWQILVPYYGRNRVLSPTMILAMKPSATAQDYLDIMKEGYQPMYNVDMTRKVGRPKKTMQKARDFGWAGRYNKKSKVGGTP